MLAPSKHFLASPPKTTNSMPLRNKNYRFISLIDKGRLHTNGRFQKLMYLERYICWFVCMYLQANQCLYILERH